MNKKELLETWFRRVWAEEDLDAIDEMMATTTSVCGLRKTPQIGPSEFKEFTKAMLNLMQNTEITIENLVEQGDWATVLMHVSAKNRKNGDPITFSGLAMARIEGDRILEAYNYVDFIGFFEQIGLLPNDTMAQCVTGNQIA